MKLCTQCQQPIPDNDYFLVGINTSISPPDSIYVHLGECRALWWEAHKTSRGSRELPIDKWQVSVV